MSVIITYLHLIVLFLARFSSMSIEFSGAMVLVLARHGWAKIPTPRPNEPDPPPKSTKHGSFFLKAGPRRGGESSYSLKRVW